MPSGTLELNGEMKERGYLDVVMSVAQWCDRGGVAMQLVSDLLIPDFLRKKEKKIMVTTCSLRCTS